MTRITKKGIIWIPRNYTINWAVKVTRSDSTVDTVTNDILNFETNMIATEAIGNFSIVLDNNAGTYDDIYTGGEVIEFYADLDDASNKILKGTVNTVEKTFSADKGQIITLKGEHVSGELLDITVTKSYADTAISTILTNIISEYLTGYTTTNVVATTDTATVNWSHKPFWDCVIELCNLAEYDCYVDNDKDFHFFAKNSILNTTEAVVSHDNFLSLEGFGTDTVEVKNRIIVYGEDDQGIPIIYTAEDSSSQTSYNVKEKIIRDSDISTMDQAKERADAELALLKDTENRGTVKSLGLTELNPGELMWISVPEQHIHSTYKVIRVSHKLTPSMGFTTECEIQKRKSKIPQLFKKRIEKDLETQQINNPNELRYSYNLTFDDNTNIDLSDDCGVTDGKLEIDEGKTTGTMITSAKTASANITSTELRIVGQDYGISKFYISVNNGVTWEEVSRETLYTVLGTGKKLKIKVQFKSNSDNPKPSLDSLCILYSTS